MLSGRVESQYFVGALSPLGHSINSHSSGRRSLRLPSLHATRIRTRAKREDRRSAVPSRHSTLCQARFGKLNASSLTEIGCALEAARDLTTSWAAAALSRETIPWCSTECRQRRSVPAP